MSNEQEHVISNFIKAYNEKEALVIYGTGINAEAIVENCVNYHIVGLMDAAKTGQKMWGLQVLSEEQILERKVSKIVVVARPTVHSIIYKRIESFVKENGIAVYDIYGNDLSKKQTIIEEDNDYFHVSYEDLWKQIEAHDVISFDIFDTLLCRKSYLPQDVFELMNSDDVLQDFPTIRVEATKSLESVANIYEIYDRIGEKCKLTEKEVDTLLHTEIEKEKQVLCIRQRMVDCLNHCIETGKEVYLVSDMYMPKALLEEILFEKGIKGYKKLFVSCEYGVSKESGLFEILKSQLENKTCLHIGDNHKSDYICAKAAGIDAFEILSPIRMMEISTYRSLLIYTNSLMERTLLGMIMSQVFNDPFSLHLSKGKPMMDSNYKWGYIFIAPLVVAFTLWLINNVKGKEDSVLLFAARDGFLFQKVYKKIKETLKIECLPSDRYLLISRKSIQSAIKKDNGYRNYLEKLDLYTQKKVFFFDFMSKGTCQLALQKILGYKIDGIYMQRGCTEKSELNQLSVLSFYSETSAMQSERRIFAMCDFLECIFSSEYPSLKAFYEDGQPIYEIETRSQRQREVVAVLQDAIIDFTNDFMEIYDRVPLNPITPDFCDEILKVTQGIFTRNILPDLENMVLDDSMNMNRNVGREIFQ